MQQLRIYERVAQAFAGTVSVAGSAVTDTVVDIARSMARAGVGILAVMCFMWHHYSSELESPARVMLAQLDDGWQYLD